MITVLSNLFEKWHHTRKVNIAVPKKTQKVKKKWPKRTIDFEID